MKRLPFLLFLLPLLALWQGLPQQLDLPRQWSRGMFSRGGCIATAGGLIFIAATADGMFRAFDQASGKIVWETQLPGNGTAIPSTYAIGQKQYVTIAVSPNPGKGYKGGYITYSLD